MFYLFLYFFWPSSGIRVSPSLLLFVTKVPLERIAELLASGSGGVSDVDEDDLT